MGNVADTHEKLRFAEFIESLAQEDPATKARVLLDKNNAFKSLGRYEEAMQALQEALHIAPQEDLLLRARLSYNMGLTVFCLGDADASLRFFQTALLEARQGDDVDLLVRILYDLGAELASQGRAQESLPLFEEAIEQARMLGSRKLEGLARWQQGDAMLSMGRPAEALASLQASIQLVVDAGFEAGLKWIFLKTGEVLEACGLPQLAVRVSAKAVETRQAESRPLAGYEQRNLERVTAKLKGRLGQAVFEQEWGIGSGLDWAELRRQVLQTKLP
jgi:tetratricopeptide (TPR) repeat protein